MTSKKTEKPQVEELSAEDLDQASGGFSLNFEEVVSSGNRKDGKGWIRIESATGDAKPDGKSDAYYDGAGNHIRNKG